MTEIGEELVGAYLTEIKACDYVMYGVRSTVPGVEGLNELDVVGLNLENRDAYLCEVTTHLGGMDWSAIRRVPKKHEFQKLYAKKYLRDFRHIEFSLWSPRVVGKKVDAIRIKGLELVINEEFTKRMNELTARAKKDHHPTNNTAYRLIQILENLHTIK